MQIVDYCLYLYSGLVYSVNPRSKQKMKFLCIIVIFSLCTVNTVTLSRGVYFLEKVGMFLGFSLLKLGKI